VSVLTRVSQTLGRATPRHGVIVHPPPLLCRHRHVDVADAVVRQRVDDGVRNGHHGAGAAGLAAALDAEWICGGRHRVMLGDKARHVDGTWYGIVHERARDRLAFAVVHDVFHQHLTDALDETAVHLPFHQHWIDDRAEIVGGGVFHHLDDAGFRVDLDLGHVAAVWECGRDGFAGELDIERLRRLIRQLDACAQRGGEFQQVDRTVLASTDTPSVGKLDVRGSGREHVRSYLLALLTPPTARLDHRHAA